MGTLWVKRVQGVQSGNQALISEGGYWLEGAVEHLDIQSLCAPATFNRATADLLSIDSGVAVVTDPEKAGPDVAEGEPSQASSSVGGLVDQAAQTSPEPNAVAIEMSFYQFFLRKMACLKAAVTADELAERWDVPKKQINDWLKQSVDEGRVRKLSKPVRYELMKDSGLGNVAAEQTAGESVGQLGLGLD